VGERSKKFFRNFMPKVSSVRESQHSWSSRIKLRSCAVRTWRALVRGSRGDVTLRMSARGVIRLPGIFISSIENKLGNDGPMVGGPTVSMTA
jgi:hypothetical protein